MFKKGNKERKDDNLPISILNQHISQLAKTLFDNDRKKIGDDKKFRFPNLDFQSFRRQASYLTILDEVYLLVLRMEVAELKLAQIDRKLSKKLKSPKIDTEKKSENTYDLSGEIKTVDSIASQKLDELKNFKENIKIAIDVEFQKFIRKS